MMLGLIVVELTRFWRQSDLPPRNEHAFLKSGGGCDCVLAFEFSWGEHIQGAVRTVGVVEDLDVAM